VGYTKEKEKEINNEKKGKKKQRASSRRAQNIIIFHILFCIVTGNHS